MGMERAKSGFTLIELLVVIAIFAILAALLLSALSGAKAKAHTAGCMSNLRQWAYGLQMFFDDSEDYFPYEGNTADALDEGYNQEGWFNTVPKSAGFQSLQDLYAANNPPQPREHSVYICPAERRKASFTLAMDNPLFTYSFNNRLDPNGPARFRRSQAMQPSETVTFTEGWGQVPYRTYDSVARHNRRAIMAFVDGHIEPIRTNAYWRSTAERTAAAEWSIPRQVYWFPFPDADK